MEISVINHSKGVRDAELQDVIRAINRQVREDFEPYWGMAAMLRLEGRSAKTPDQAVAADMRGDAVIYLWDQADVADAIGYHDRNDHGVPFGFVFTEISKQLGEPWSVTLSHEALELIGDPETNLLVIGPHPNESREVFYWYEMCDAVQAETYKIDGVAVSNFVLPLYFTGTRDFDELGARNDFLANTNQGFSLASFGVNPGGYVGFYDPKLNDNATFHLAGDRKAGERLLIKSQAKEARRAVRYADFANRARLREAASSGVAKAGRSARKPVQIVPVGKSLEPEVLDKPRK